jgi:hypothetical protein
MKRRHHERDLRGINRHLIMSDANRLSLSVPFTVFAFRFVFVSPSQLRISFVVCPSLHISRTRATPNTTLRLLVSFPILSVPILIGPFESFVVFVAF